MREQTIMSILVLQLVIYIIVPKINTKTCAVVSDSPNSWQRIFSPWMRMPWKSFQIQFKRSLRIFMSAEVKLQNLKSFRWHARWTNPHFSHKSRRFCERLMVFKCAKINFCSCSHCTKTIWKRVWCQKVFNFECHRSLHLLKPQKLRPPHLHTHTDQSTYLKSESRHFSCSGLFFCSLKTGYIDVCTLWNFATSEVGGKIVSHCFPRRETSTDHDTLWSESFCSFLSFYFYQERAHFNGFRLASLKPHKNKFQQSYRLRIAQSFSRTARSPFSLPFCSTHRWHSC